MVGLTGKGADGVLAFLGGGADVAAVGETGREAERAEVGHAGLDHVLRNGGLAEDGHLVRVGEVGAKGRGVGTGLDDADAFGGFAEDADDLVMAFVADKGDGEGLGGVGAGLGMDFADEWAGGVDDLKPAGLGLRPDGGGDAVRREEHARAARHLGQVVHEARAAGPQSGDDVFIVDKLVKAPKRLARALGERAQRDPERPGHAAAQTMGLSHQNTHFYPFRSCLPKGFHHSTFPARRSRAPISPQGKRI